MPVRRLFSRPHVLWQTGDDPDCPIPEPAIAIHTDATGLLMLDQEGREILINRASVPELIATLKLLTKVSK